MADRGSGETGHEIPASERRTIAAFTAALVASKPWVWAPMKQSERNIDDATARAFDDNWGAITTSHDSARGQRVFDDFFGLFPFDELGGEEGFELGCGFGRHAARVAPRVGRLHCIDQSPRGIEAARRRLGDRDNVEFHIASVDSIPLEDGSQGFGYSMGVLHHIPDTKAALNSCVAKLRPGAPFLLYLYYAFDNRPAWFRAVWRVSESGRWVVSRLPFALRRLASALIAALVYWPLSRAALVLERAGLDVSPIPLSYYRRTPSSSLRWEALDRFGTPLEQRFSRAEIERMMRESGLGEIRFQETEPYWVAIGRKRAD